MNENNTNLENNNIVLFIERVPIGSKFGFSVYMCAFDI